MIAGTTNGVSSLFLKGGTDYSLAQQISDFTQFIYAQAISPDKSILCVGGAENAVKVYQNVSGSFVLIQTISLGYRIYDIKVTSEKMLIAGISPMLRFYDFNGSIF